MTAAHDAELLAERLIELTDLLGQSATNDEMANLMGWSLDRTNEAVDYLEALGLMKSEPLA